MNEKLHFRLTLAINILAVIIAFTIAWLWGNLWAAGFILLVFLINPARVVRSFLIRQHNRRMDLFET